MVIQMVACQVGIRRRGDGQTVEPELVKSVARSLDSHVLDPLSCKLGQIAVQGYRVGRSQGSGAMRGGGNQTERAEACCRMAERRPDFACEVDDRGLAVGARDGGDYPGLSAAESCRQQRQAARWICVDYNAIRSRCCGESRSAVALSVRMATAPASAACAAN